MKNFSSNAMEIFVNSTLYLSLICQYWMQKKQFQVEGTQNNWLTKMVQNWFPASNSHDWFYSHLLLIHTQVVISKQSYCSLITSTIWFSVGANHDKRKVFCIGIALQKDLSQKLIFCRESDSAITTVVFHETPNGKKKASAK